MPGTFTVARGCTSVRWATGDHPPGWFAKTSKTGTAGSSTQNWATPAARYSACLAYQVLVVAGVKHVDHHQRGVPHQVTGRRRREDHDVRDADQLAIADHPTGAGDDLGRGGCRWL